jgi:hypothetical protein
MFVSICGKIFNKNHILYIAEEIEHVCDLSSYKIGDDKIPDERYEYYIRVVLRSDDVACREIICSCDNEEHLYQEYKELCINLLN